MAASLAGFTIPIRSREEVTSPIALGAPIAGVGLRSPFYWPYWLSTGRWLLQNMRLNAGFIWFDQEDPNPLVDRKLTKFDAFASLTLDVDYKAILGPLGNLIK
jgi:hypothetical protein